jgi:molybdopterin converting factor small subunit
MQVLIPTALQSYTHASRVEAGGRTLGEMFAELEQRYPGIRFRIVDEQDRMRRNMRVFVNGLGVRELDHPLKPGDDVGIVMALSGG